MNLIATVWGVVIWIAISLALGLVVARFCDKLQAMVTIATVHVLGYVSLFFGLVFMVFGAMGFSVTSAFLPGVLCLVGFPVARWVGDPRRFPSMRQGDHPPRI